MGKGFVTILFVSGSERTPVLPGNWVANPESSNWFTARNTNNNLFFHLFEAIDGSTIGFPNRSVFLACGEKTLLRSLYQWGNSNGYDLWTLPQLRSDSGARARAIKQAWKTHISGTNTINFGHTMAGFSYPGDLENTNNFEDLD